MCEPPSATLLHYVFNFICQIKCLKLYIIFVFFILYVPGYHYKHNQWKCRNLFYCTRCKGFRLEYLYIDIQPFELSLLSKYKYGRQMLQTFGLLNSTCPYSKSYSFPVHSDRNDKCWCYFSKPSVSILIFLLLNWKKYFDKLRSNLSYSIVKYYSEETVIYTF